MTTKKPIKTYNAFEVVLVPFPFIDQSSTKKRPAVVLSSSSKFNIKIGASILAMITTSGHNPWPCDIFLSDLLSAGLPAPSIIRMKLFTIDHRLILKKIGVLHKKDQQALAESLSTIFNLPARSLAGLAPSIAPEDAHQYLANEKAVLSETT